MSKLLLLSALSGAVLVASIINPLSKAYAAINMNSPLFQDDRQTLFVNANQVLSADGHVFIPEGISVYGGLEDSDYMLNVANDDAQIIAAAKYWHANTIRLQIAESTLFKDITPGFTYNNKFLQAIIGQVNLAQSLNLVVVLNDQTEFTSKTPGPTVQTSKFWKVMSQEFRDHPYVIFDLFNEPRVEGYRQTVSNNQGMTLGTPNSLHDRRQQNTVQSSPAKTWGLWRDGGKVNGITYIGIQALVNQIRAYGVNNLIWVEGPNEARELPSANYLISGSNVIYSIHHPNLNNTSSWDQIGRLSKIAPVVDGEWAQYQSPWAECFSRAYTNAPLYINYLHKHNVGIIAWSLQAGSLLQDSNHKRPTNTNTPNDPKQASQLKTPSKLLPNYSCNNGFDQGVGQLLQAYFARNSSNNTPYLTR